MFDYTLKVIIFGDLGVGKTTLSKITSISMSPETSRKPVGVDFYVKDIQLKYDNDFKLENKGKVVNLLNPTSNPSKESNSPIKSGKEMRSL